MSLETKQNYLLLHEKLVTGTPPSIMLTNLLFIFPNHEFGRCPLPESPGDLKESIFCYCIAYICDVQWVDTYINWIQSHGLWFQQSSPTGHWHMSLSGCVPIYTADTWFVTHTIFLNNRNEDEESPKQYRAKNTLGCLATSFAFPSLFVSFVIQVA